MELLDKIINDLELAQLYKVQVQIDMRIMEVITEYDISIADANMIKHKAIQSFSYDSEKTGITPNP